MPVISDDQIAAAVVKAGFPQSKRVPKGSPASGIRVVANFVAIALAESSGNTDAKNNFGAGHYGLWQISALHFNPNQVNWRDPNVNAGMAFTVFEKQGYGAWTVYTNGRYLAYLNRGKIAAEKALNAKYPPLVPDLGLGDGLKAAKDFASFITDRNNWIRLGLFAAGFFIIIIGLVKISAPVAAKAAKAVPVGKIAGAVR